VPGRTTETRTGQRHKARGAITKACAVDHRTADRSCIFSIRPDVSVHSCRASRFNCVRAASSRSSPRRQRRRGLNAEPPPAALKRTNDTPSYHKTPLQKKMPAHDEELRRVNDHSTSLPHTHGGHTRCPRQEAPFRARVIPNSTTERNTAHAGRDKHMTHRAKNMYVPLGSPPDARARVAGKQTWTARDDTPTR